MSREAIDNGVYAAPDQFKVASAITSAGVAGELILRQLAEQWPPIEGGAPVAPVAVAYEAGPVGDAQESSRVFVADRADLLK